jgi:hypothetical protein
VKTPPTAPPPAHRPAEGAAIARPPPDLLLTLPLRRRQLRNEGVARLLQLLYTRDVGHRTSRRGGQVGRKVGRVGSELRLEPGDLPTQLLPNLDHFALCLRVRQLRSLVVEFGWQSGARHCDDPEVPRAQPGLPCSLHCLRGDRLQLRRRLHPRGNKGALSVAADDEPVLLQPLVDGAHRAYIHPCPLGKLAEARQALAHT